MTPFPGIAGWPTPSTRPEPAGLAPDESARTVVTIAVPVKVEAGANAGRRTVSGRVRCQGCTQIARLPPAEMGVRVDLEIGNKEEERT